MHAEPDIDLGTDGRVDVYFVAFLELPYTVHASIADGVEQDFHARQEVIVLLDDVIDDLQIPGRGIHFPQRHPGLGLVLAAEIPFGIMIGFRRRCLACRLFG